jgi:hypothetical protein
MRLHELMQDWSKNEKEKRIILNFVQAFQYFTMRILIQRTIDLLKKKIKENLETINQNQIRLGEKLKEPLSAERTYCVEKIYSANKALLSENSDFVNLQRSLVNFLEKYQDTLSLSEDKEEPVDPEVAAYLDDDEVFRLTVEGKLGFEFNHPKFEDEGFFNRLLTYYTSTEAYEKCNALLSVKRQNHVR